MGCGEQTSYPIGFGSGAPFHSALLPKHINPHDLIPLSKVNSIPVMFSYLSRIKASVSSSGKSFPLLVLALLLAAVAARLYGLDSEVFWYDEIESIRKADAETLSDVIQGVLQTERTPPTYFILLHYWRNFFPQTLWVRGFSVFASLGCCCIVGLLAFGMGGKRLAYASLLLMALSQYQVYYAQEARVYALLMLVSLASWASLLRACRARSSWKHWLCYGFLTLFGTNLHLFFWLSYAAQAAWLVYHLSYTHLLNRKHLKAFAFAWVFVLLGSVPALWILFGQISQAGPDWIPPMDWTNFRRILLSMSCGVYVPFAKWAVAACLITCIPGWVWFAFSKRYPSLEKSAVLFAAWLPMVLMIGVSFYRPIVYYGTRYLCIVHAFLLLAFAGGLLAIPKRLGWIGIGLVLVIWTQALEANVRFIQKRRYDTIAEIIFKEQRPDDRVIIHPSYCYECLSFFQPGIIPAMICPKEQWQSRLERRLHAGKRVWVVSISPKPCSQERLMAPYARSDLSLQVNNGPYVRVARYSKR